MKKDLTAKKLKKLKLNRETLRNLDERDLQAAIGGATVSACSACCTRFSCFC